MVALFKRRRCWGAWKVDENEYRITMAVAGFAESELSVEARDATVTIEGKPAEDRDAARQAPQSSTTATASTSRMKRGSVASRTISTVVLAGRCSGPQ